MINVLEITTFLKKNKKLHEFKNNKKSIYKYCKRANSLEFEKECEQENIFDFTELEMYQRPFCYTRYKIISPFRLHKPPKNYIIFNEKE